MMAITIEISDAQAHLAIDPDSIRDLARRVLEGEGVRHALVSIAFVDDASIHAINREHLDHDWPTDVITFRLSDPGDALLDAELVVSAEMAVTTARESGADPSAELVLYVVHGLLHLCGHDDRTGRDSELMRRREDEVLKREGWENTFARVGPNSAGPGRGGEPCTA